MHDILSFPRFGARDRALEANLFKVTMTDDIFALLAMSRTREGTLEACMNIALILEHKAWQNSVFHSSCSTPHCIKHTRNSQRDCFHSFSTRPEPLEFSTIFVSCALLEPLCSYGIYYFSRELFMLFYHSSADALVLCWRIKGTFPVGSQRFR